MGGVDSSASTLNVETAPLVAFTGRFSVRLSDLSAALEELRRLRRVAEEEEARREELEPSLEGGRREASGDGTRRSCATRRGDRTVLSSARGEPITLPARPKSV